jgi:hypothetical protein
MIHPNTVYASTTWTSIASQETTSDQSSFILSAWKRSVYILTKYIASELTPNLKGLWSRPLPSFLLCCALPSYDERADAVSIGSWQLNMACSRIISKHWPARGNTCCNSNSMAQVQCRTRLSPAPTVPLAATVSASLESLWTLRIVLWGCHTGRPAARLPSLTCVAVCPWRNPPGNRVA